MYQEKYFNNDNRLNSQAYGSSSHTFLGCTVEESYCDIQGEIHHIVSFRLCDCRRYLSAEEIRKILIELGMDIDAPIQQLTLRNHSMPGSTVYYIQPAA